LTFATAAADGLLKSRAARTNFRERVRATYLGIQSYIRTNPVSMIDGQP